MRVLHCIHSLVGGGAERQLKLLIEEANNNGEKYALFCVNDVGNDLPLELVKVYRATNNFKLSLFKEIHQAINDFEPEIIQVWLPESITIPAMIVAKLHHIPVIFSYRNKMRFSRFLSVVEYVIAWACSVGIVSNNSIKSSKIQYRFLFNNKINEVIPNAVKVDPVYKKTVYSKSVLPKKILFVGRLTEQKNWKCLINALPDVIKKYKYIKVLICGDGEDLSLLLALIEQLDLSRYVELRGYESNVYLFMQNADVLVLPSWYEGMPNVLLEALEIGLPCIVSNIEAHLSVLNGSNATLLFDPKSPADLSSKLLSFLFNDEFNVMVKEGKKLVSQYKPFKLANSYKQFYLKII